MEGSLTQENKSKLNVKPLTLEFVHDIPLNFFYCSKTINMTHVVNYAYYLAYLKKKTIKCLLREYYKDGFNDLR